MFRLQKNSRVGATTVQRKRCLPLILTSTTDTASGKRRTHCIEPAFSRVCHLHHLAIIIPTPQQQQKFRRNGRSKTSVSAFNRTPTSREAKEAVSTYSSCKVDSTKSLLCSGTNVTADLHKQEDGSEKHRPILFISFIPQF